MVQGSVGCQFQHKCAVSGRLDSSECGPGLQCSSGVGAVVGAGISLGVGSGLVGIGGGSGVGAGVSSGVSCEAVCAGIGSV